MGLTPAQFWNTINLIDRVAVRNDPDDPRAMSALAAYLESCSIPELEQFEQQLSQLLHDIDGEQYYDAAGINSGDGFLYCRCFVVAMGQNFYTQILEDPNSMPDTEYEPLLYLASRAWAAKTGNTPDDWDFFPSVSYETGANTHRWSPQLAIRLTAEQKAEQFEVGYQRALSSAVHVHRRKSFDYVVELLAPYEDRLSKKFIDILADARSQIESSYKG